MNKYQFAIDNLGMTDWPQAERATSGKEEGVYTTSEIQHFAKTLNDAYTIYRTTNGVIYVDDNEEIKEELYLGPTQQ